MTTSEAERRVIEAARAWARAHAADVAQRDEFLRTNVTPLDGHKHLRAMTRAETEFKAAALALSRAEDDYRRLAEARAEEGEDRGPAPDQPSGHLIDLVAGLPVWSPELAYDRGVFVYHAGFFWEARCANAGHRPDTNSVAWEMAPHPGALIVTDLAEEGQ